jgi:hypothetical protein
MCCLPARLHHPGMTFGPPPDTCCASFRLSIARRGSSACPVQSHPTAWACDARTGLITACVSQGAPGNIQRCPRAVAAHLPRPHRHRCACRTVQQSLVYVRADPHTLPVPQSSPVGAAGTKTLLPVMQGPTQWGPAGPRLPLMRGSQLGPEAAQHTITRTASSSVLPPNTTAAAPAVRPALAPAQHARPVSPAPSSPTNTPTACPQRAGRGLTLHQSNTNHVNNSSRSSRSILTRRQRYDVCVSSVSRSPTAFTAPSLAGGPATTAHTDSSHMNR